MYMASFTKKMKETGTVVFCVLMIFYCAVTKGDHDGSTTPPPIPSVTPPATSSSPQTSSNSQPDSLVNATDVHLNVSSETARVPVNGSLAQDDRDASNTTITTITPATHAPAATGTVGDSTDIPLNTTESGDSGDTQTASSRPAATVILHTSLQTTRASRDQPQTSTSSPPMESQPPPAPTGPRVTAASRNTLTTSPGTISAQTWHKTLSVSAQHVTAPVITSTTSTSSTTTTTTTTTQNTKAISTPVQAKSRAETPSELNVGDDVSSASLDPLLAGLVSVFVVTTAIISLVIFLKFRHRGERPEFCRLQDLPMDDMMEDTPLSMYSY